jgi:hypothetical protein
VGGTRANDALSLRRATAVSRFLEHYGASASQIEVRGDGERNPEVRSTDANSRFMNRRVVIHVTSPDGKVIGDGSLTAAVNEFQSYARSQLSKIDAILTQLQDLQNQVRALQTDAGAARQETASIKEDTTTVRQNAAAILSDTQELVKRPPPLTSEQTTDISRTESHRAADDTLVQEALRNRKYSMVGFSAGPTFGAGRTGVMSGDIFGRALIPFGNGRTPDERGTHALQVDGDWIHFRRRSARPDGLTDAMFSIGLVNRFGAFQVGTFAQFDYVTLNSYQGSALLGSTIVTLDYVFRGGSFGVFGAKGFRDYASVGTTALPGTGLTPAYFRYQDQIGMHSNGTLGRYLFIESSVAFKKRYSLAATHLPSSTLKLAFPMNDHVALFVEGSQNTTFQNIRTGQRVVFGLQFGNWTRPSRYSENESVVPVMVPRPHYELLGK